MQPELGKIGWCDLTIENADEVRDFYKQVVGWSHSDVGMGEYSDYCMMPAGSDAPTCGICHARGPNADVPTAWIVYFTVENLEQSLEQVTARGGEQIGDIRSAGGKFCLIRDPAGAICALYQA